MSDEAKAKKEEKEKKGKEPKEPKEKGGGNIVVTLMLAVMGLLLLAVIGLGVYIFVFPDDWPKPFYVNMEPPVAEAAAPEGGDHGSAEAAQPIVESEAALPAALPMPGEGLMFDTGTKVVNLADPGGRRYLKLAVVLEFAPHEAEFYTLAGEERAAAATLFGEEMASKKPIIDDLLNTLISSKTYEEIYTVEGKEALRNDLISRINILLPGEHLMYVYFTEFVVQ